MYRVRCLYYHGASFRLCEHVDECSDYDSAVQQFAFYVDCALKLHMDNIRCCNILRGKKSIKLFQNH